MSPVLPLMEHRLKSYEQIPLVVHILGYALYKEAILMVDAAGAGYPPGGYPGGGMGGSCGPGYGMTFSDRLQSSVGKNVTVYVGEGSSPVTGTLHGVGSNYVEVRRTNNNAGETMLILMQAITAISVPT